MIKSDKEKYTKKTPMEGSQITIHSNAKINLSLDVLGKMDDGYHRVEMIMHQIQLHDDIAVTWSPENNGIKISTNRRYLPTDERNLAFKAAELMISSYGKKGSVTIDIRKRIPVAAGLAGGSANGASVILALAYLWQLDATVSELCALGEKLGADVPFCLRGQAASNKALGDKYNRDPYAGTCALAEGIGTQLTSIPPLDCYIVLSKPPVSCSTREIYKEIDRVEIAARPDTKELIDAIVQKNWPIIAKNMVNTLENVTLRRYPIVVYTKNKMIGCRGALAVMMSGSGPTVFGIFPDREKAKACYLLMKAEFRDSFLTHTSYLSLCPEELKHDKL